MTTGKIDRNAVVSQLNRPGQTSTIAPAAKVAEVAQKTVEPENLFGERSKHLDTKSGEGKAVSATASADQLWGISTLARQNPPLAAMTLKNLPPEQRAAKKAELETKRQGIEKNIQARAEQLDRKWKYSSLTKRTEALREYLTATPNVPPEVRTEIEAACKMADDAQAKISKTLADVHELKTDPKTGKAGTPEQRAEALKKVLAARKERSEVVKAATEAIDAVGLKIERLALTEQKMDPEGAKSSPIGSMMELVGQYFEVRFMLDVLFILDTALGFLKDMEKQAQEAEKRRMIEEQWRQRDELMRRMIKEIPIKTEIVKVKVESSGARNVATAPVTEIAKLERKQKVT